MSIISEPITSISFKKVVEFCDEGHIEGIELDYKGDLSAKGLAKHIAAFSNVRGGLIIIGVEEDPKTGKPLKYEGVVNDGKLVDRIHQYASQVQPLPLYDVRTTDEVNGKVFLVVRIYPGDRTPYYVENDARLYVRTGNITKLLDDASPDAAELLFNRRTKADASRELNLMQAKRVFDAGLSQAEAAHRRWQ